MEKKKVLMLGGSFFQVPAIKYAKEAGYYVITCDYLPDNPGHKYADEYYNLSTTDLEEVLELSKKLNIDGIVAYASDPAAPTAAYVSEKLGLPGNSYSCVKTLTEKDLFREFLSKNEFNVPFAKGYTSYEKLESEINNFIFPIIIKPVDSSGSKGISKITSKDDLEKGFNYALSFSRNKRVVVEEFIVNNGPQLHGDAFVIDGKLEFCYLGDHHYNTDINPFVPYSTTLPSVHSNYILEEVETELQKLINIIGLKQGALNIEARVNRENKIFLMEIGPRNGGNLVPQLEQYATGFDMVSASVDIATGNLSAISSYKKQGFVSYYVIHSENEGILDSISISLELEKNILEEHTFKNKGEKINVFNGSNATIGILLLEFKSMSEMNEKINNMNNFVKVNLQ